MRREPIIKNAMAFIDGQNLFRHAKEAFGYHHPNFDPKKLSEAVCQAFGFRLTLVHVYSGTPQWEDDPVGCAIWNNRALSWGRNGVQFIKSPLRYRIKGQDQAGKDIVDVKEKGSDVKLALDVFGKAVKRQYDVAIIFSQDQDLAGLVPAVRDIAAEQSRYIKLVSAYPVSASASSRRGINGTDWFEMDREFYDRCLDPRDYRPKK